MGNEPRLGSKVFYKIGEVSKIRSCRLMSCGFGSRSLASSNQRKAAAISDYTSSEMWIRCWRSSGCSTKKGTRWLASSATGLVEDGPR